MAKVKCPKCSYVNPDGQSNCIRCQTPLPKIKIEASAPKPAFTPGMEAVQFQRGQVLANRYTVLNLIGRGGMGCIYKVHDNTLNEEVALKTLLPHFVRDKLVVQRFFNEARIARRLAHPNIVRVHDIGSTGDVIYISMEYLEGKSLRGILENLAPGQRLPIRRVLHIMDELCSALEYAHQYTVHRDIKPENVMIGADGSVKLMDFGISKLMANTRLTGASVVMGTPFYMSPEQLRNSRDVDARADIYSVGVMLYEVLTGVMPTGVPKAASEMLKEAPPALDAVIAKCVDPAPEKRYQNAAELRAALLPVRQLLMAGNTLEEVADKVKAPPRFSMRKVMGGAGLLFILAGAAAGLYGAEQYRRVQSIATPLTSLSEEVLPSFLSLEEVVHEVQSIAKLHLSGLKERERVYKEAGLLWEAACAEKERNPNLAQTLGQQTLQYYLALVMWPKDNSMVFIPAGKVTVDGREYTEAPFFIDANEVTIEEFARFCDSVEQGWRFPEELSQYRNTYPKLPISMVSFFDAQAYAAYCDKRLPSHIQWARAAYGYPPDASHAFPWGDAWKEDAANTENTTARWSPVGEFETDRSHSGCYDMVGNVSEWTRTLVTPSETPPTFGSFLTICGGNYQSKAIPLEDTQKQRYEKRLPYLGFRCVREIPASAAVVRAWLKSIH